MGFFSATPAWGGLVARWEFDNFDPSNPTSAAVLAPDVGNLSAIPCEGKNTSTRIEDGTLGSIYVIGNKDVPGLPDGDYALAIPEGAHLWIPLPSGIVRDKNWMMRIRFCSPAASAGVLRALVTGNATDTTDGIFYISNLNLIQGREILFGADSIENGNYSQAQGDNTYVSRLVQSDTWYSFAAYFGENGAASTLNGIRSASGMFNTDIRTSFTGDGFFLCAGGAEKLTYIASVEVWDDMPCRHIDGYIPAANTAAFPGASIDEVRDSYLSVRKAGSWGGYGYPMSSFEKVVATDEAGNTTDVKVDFCMWNDVAHCFVDFAANGSGVDCRYLRMGYGVAWGVPFFAADGSFIEGGGRNYTGGNGNSASTNPTVWGNTCSWNAQGYWPYGLYALPFIPLAGNANWSYFMGTGKFGNPVVTVVALNPVLTFDAAPQVDSLELDCGRGDGQASLSFAYGDATFKNMAAFGDLSIKRNVTLALPAGVSIAGSLVIERGAAISFASDGATLEDGSVLFTAAGGIEVPEGVETATFATVNGGSAALSADGKSFVYRSLAPDVPASARWVGGGNRDVASDPLNWVCQNSAGDPLDGAVPNEHTAITVSGETTFNIPAGQSLVCRSLSIGSCTLAADCDWSGLGATLPVENGAAVELGGFSLSLAGLGLTKGSFTLSNNASNLSTLRVTVAPDSVTDSTQVSIAGNIKFVKDGAGTYNANRGHTYTGGTEILGGTSCSSLNAVDSNIYGVGGSTVLVRNATLRLDGVSWFSLYRLKLDGGTLCSTYTTALLQQSDGAAIFGMTTLLSDSSLSSENNGRIRLWPWNAIDLGTHTLEANLQDNGEFVLATADNNPNSMPSITNGTLAVSGGTLRVYQGYTVPVNMTSTTLRMNGALNLPAGSTINLRDYEALYDGTGNSGTGILNVSGTFKPVGTGFFGPVLNGDATLDLSEWAGAWPLASGATGGVTTPKVANGASITVKLGNDLARFRSLALTKDGGTYAGYLLKWDGAAPEEASFTLEEAAKKRYALKADSTGLLLCPFLGIVVVVK